MRTLVDKGRFKGYDVGPDMIEESDVTALETSVSPNDMTTFAYLDLEEDEFYRIGQGEDRGPEYTRGRIHMALDDGAGNAPADSTRVRVVKLSSQNNVQKVLWKGKYSQLKQGSGDRTARIALPEVGQEIVSEPSRIGLRAEAGGGSTYTVDLSTSDIEIDAVSGEQ